VWGLKPNDVGGMTEVRLHGGGSAIQLELQMKTTQLVDITERKEFDIEEFLSKEKDLLEAPGIFELYKKLSRLPNNLQDICYDYAKGDIGRWWKFMENADKV
jgi:hypothetical protein